MLKRKLYTALVGVLAFASAAPALSAQGIDVKLTINTSNKVVPTDNNGGAWKAAITLDANPGPLPNFVLSGGLPIVYCIDNSRFFNNGTYNMTMLTFGDFLAVAATKPGPFNTIVANDLNAMATIASTYSALAVDAAANGDKQENIWKISNGNVNPATLYPSVTFFDQSANWRVLVDRQDWFGTGNDSRTNGVQTFLVQIEGGQVVPEPASFALVGAGLVALAVVSRRRNNVS